MGGRQLGFAMIVRIDHIVMNCRDVETTASWYERALGFKREAYVSPAEPVSVSRSSSGGTSSISGNRQLGLGYMQSRRTRLS
jgi:4-hydroxyphenylpyruvate dioxygenase-like putative hemolysin